MLDFLDGDNEHQKRERTWYRRKPEEMPQRKVELMQQDERDKRTKHCTGVIHRRMKTKRSPSRFLISRIREKRITRRRANSFPNPVNQADAKHLPRCLRNCSEWTGNRRNAVSDDNERLSLPDFVRPPPARKLQKRGSRFRRALDCTDE